jgi:hypothetical protein
MQSHSRLTLCTAAVQVLPFIAGHPWALAALVFLVLLGSWRSEP